MYDRNIPIPVARDAARRRPDSITGQIRGMALGDSYLLADRDVTEASRFIHKARKGRPGAAYKSRTVEGGVRIWCTALPVEELDAAAIDLFS